MSDKIKERFSTIKELNEEVYNILTQDKLEFDRLTRLKKRVKQLLRKYKVGGLSAIFNNLFSKKVIDRINSPSDKKKILYITITPSFNLLRQSIYIRKDGNYETILLLESPWLLKLMEKHFDVVHIYDTYYELAQILKEVKPYLIHVQGAMLGSDFLCILAKLLSKTKVIFEFYDVPSLFISMEDSISVWGNKNTELGFFAEQYACENADGIILGYSCEAADILKKRYDIKAPILEFHSYVCTEFVSKKNITKYSHEDGKIHFVLGGFVAPSKFPKRIFGDCQYHELIEVITKQGICLDIFTTPHASSIKFKQIYSDYIAISSTNNLFRINKGLLPDEAADGFSRYDFGIMSILYNQEISRSESLNTRIPGRFFLYIEAGLPIITCEELKYVSKLVRDYEIGIVVSQKDVHRLSRIISKHDYEKLKNNVISVREKLSMETHINTLLRFYEDCPS